MLRLMDLNTIDVRSQKSYFIKNKDKTLARISIDHNGNISEVSGNLPVFISSNLRGWLDSRTPPKHRTHMKSLMNQMNMHELTDILDFSKGLSLNDTFWVCPVDQELSWSTINLFDNEFNETIAKIAFTGGLYSVQFSTTSPEFATNGMLPKCWVRDKNSTINLIKAGTEGFGNTGREPYCEVMASQILDKLGYRHVHYELVRYHGKVASSCPLITSKELAMAPSFMMLSFSTFNGFINSCVRNGFGGQLAEYLIFDFLTCNPDRHAGNISVMFDTANFELLGLSPIYDNGMSCLCYIVSNDTWQDYYKTLQPSLYDDFRDGAEVGKLLRKKDHNVESLIGFTFDRSQLGGMPEQRVAMVEEFLQNRVYEFLNLEI